MTKPLTLASGAWYLDALGRSVHITGLDPFSPNDDLFVGLRDPEVAGGTWAQRYFADGRCYARGKDFTLVAFDETHAQLELAA